MKYFLLFEIWGSVFTKSKKGLVVKTPKFTPDLLKSKKRIGLSWWLHAELIQFDFIVGTIAVVREKKDGFPKSFQSTIDDGLMNSVYVCGPFYMTFLF